MRIYADDSLSLQLPFPSIAIYPLLYFNMASPQSLNLLPASQYQQKSFPVAKSVTVARVASAHSMHKRYQPALLLALKAYFQDKDRIVKQGDVIAVPLSESLVRFSAEEDENDAAESVTENDDEDAQK